MQTKYTMQDVINRVAQITSEQLAEYKNLPFCHKNKHDPEIDAFIQDLGIEIYVGYDQQFCDNVTAYPINTWMCTDTIVGVLAYFFRDEFVALSFQRGRKWDVEIVWVSQEHADQVRTYILSLLDVAEQVANIIDVNEQIDEFWLESN